MLTESERARMTAHDALTGADRLRRAVKAFGSCRESFLDAYTPAELLMIHRAWVSSDWDIYPDEWELAQLEQAIRGQPPRWDADGKPVYE